MLNTPSQHNGLGVIWMKSTSSENQTVDISTNFSTADIHFSLSTNNADVIPPLVSEILKQTSASQHLFLYSSVEEPKYAHVIISRGIMTMQLFSSSTSTNIIGVVTSLVPFEFIDDNFPESIVIQRHELYSEVELAVD